MFTFVATYLHTCYLYTDIIKSNMQEKIKYEERRSEKGLVVLVDIYKYIATHQKILNVIENLIMCLLATESKPYKLCHTLPLFYSQTK